jgi:hypothetical protein
MKVGAREIQPEWPVSRLWEAFQYPIEQQKTKTKKLFPQESIRV